MDGKDIAYQNLSSAFAPAVLCEAQRKFEPIRVSKIVLHHTPDLCTCTLKVDLILPYTDVCIALYTQCFPSVCGKNFTDDSGGIRTHDLLLTSANVLTSRPPSLPNDDWLARILFSSGFHDIHRLMKFLRQVINN